MKDIPMGKLVRFRPQVQEKIYTRTKYLFRIGVALGVLHLLFHEVPMLVIFGYFIYKLMQP